MPKLMRHALVGVMFLIQTCLAWQALGGLAGITGPWPVLVDDHIFNYYCSTITRTFLAESGSTAGYDPHFMAGYAKSILWPPSSTLPELVLFLFGARNPVCAYKLYVFTSFIVAPLCVWLAVRSFERNSFAATAGLALYLVLFWTDVPMYYMRLGLVSFVLSTAEGLLTGACFLRVLDGKAGWARVGLLLLLPLACLTHVTVPVVLGPPFAATYLAAFRRLSRADHACIWSAVAATLVANSFWVLPGLVLWETRGPTDPFFVNPEGLTRLVELFTRAPLIELVLVCGGVLGFFLVPRLRAARWLFLATLGWAFFLGYGAGSLGVMQFMQHGRHTLNFFLWCLPLASGLLYEIHALSTTRWGLRGAVLSAIGTAGLVGLAGGLRFLQNTLPIARGAGVLLPSELPTEHQEVLNWIRQNTQPGERIFFEERNRGFPSSPDPMATHRLSAIIPLDHPVELVGGPYMGVQLASRFSQIGDGSFVGGKPWGRTEFIAYANLYAPQYLICWSLPARQFCFANPDLVSVELEARGFLVCRVRGAIGPAFKGTCRVQARLNEIHVEQAAADQGELILRYHWVPGLRPDPGVRISPRRILDDPVPFIVVVDPPESFTIRFDLWHLLLFYESG